MKDENTASAGTQSSEKPYRTSDMYLAAYLMLAKAEFVRIDKEDRRSFFIFERTPGFDKLVAQFFNGKGTVPANEFAAKIKDVKTLTHSG